MFNGTSTQKGADCGGVASSISYPQFVYLPQLTIPPLQRVQSYTARLKVGIGRRDHVTPALQKLDWLPIPCRLTHDLCVLIHQVHAGRSSPCMSKLVTAIAYLPMIDRYVMRHWSLLVQAAQKKRHIRMCIHSYLDQPSAS